MKAPFNGMIIEEFVDKGQVLAPSSRIATLVDSDTFWVRVSVPVDRLPWIRIPEINGEKEGSPATITHEISKDSKVTRIGHVIRLLGDLDARGKMARLLVEVNDPLKTGENADSKLPLFIGAYVSVAIDGPQIDNVIEIPRRALRENDTVWIKKDGLLSIVPVEVVWKVEDRIFLKGDIQSGDMVVMNHIAAPVEGMKIILETDIVDDEEAVPDNSRTANNAENGQASR